MKNLLIFLFTSVGVLAQTPTVTINTVNDYNVNGAHSTFKVVFSSSITPTNIRIEWGPTNSYGRVIYPVTLSGISTTNNQMYVSGLQAGIDMDGGRVVHFRACAENGGSGWGCSVDTTVTIPALPTIHPTPATLPESFALSQPNESGCTVQTAANDLSDLQAKITTASNNQATVCQVVIIPAGSIGTAFVSLPTSTDTDRFTYDVATNIITNTTNINTFANGDRIRVSNNLFTGVSLPSGVTRAYDYCVSNVSGSTFKLTAWPSCSGVVSLGTAGSGNPYMQPFPPRITNYITIRSNGVYSPEGVQIAPQWQDAANVARWKPTFSSVAQSTTNPYNYGSVMIYPFAHNYFIGPGIDFTSANSSQTTTTDPSPWPTRIFMDASNSYIGIKRNWITGVGYPERQTNPMFFEGSYVDFAENYMTGLDNWRPYYSGFTTSIVGGTVSIAAGVYRSNLGYCASVGAYSVTLTGATSGSVYTIINPATCTVYAYAPSGTTITCTGCTAMVGSGWPVDGNGSYTQAGIAYCNYTTGNFTACVAGGDTQYGVGELQTITSFGPGPIRRANNYESSHGIEWNIDDGGSGTSLIPSDITITRNTFLVPDKYRVGSPTNNGFIYYNRQPLECKRCNKVLVKGNYFPNQFKLTTAQGAAMLFSFSNIGCSNCQVISGDTTIDSNYIVNSSGGISAAFTFPTITNQGLLKRRYTITNNYLSNINGYTNYSVTPFNGPANGICFEVSAGGEDIILDHNTCYNSAGSFPQLTQFTTQMVEGFKLTNNAFYVGNDNGRLGSTGDWGASGTNNPNCSSLNGGGTLNCVTNTVSYVGNNLIVAGYNNTQTMTGASNAATWNTSYAGFTNTWIPSDGTVPARIASAKWSNPIIGDYRFTQSSLYVSGGTDHATDGLDVGVDQNAVLNALGWLRNIRTLTVTSTGFTIGFYTPDATATCYLKYGVGSSVIGWGSVTDNSGVNERAVSITGLTSKTAYNYQVMCGGGITTPTMVVRTL